jgi:ribosomal peptide maturation radical SAM protein 1
LSAHSTASDFDILLLSMPWMKGDWPCLGIASLKSYLQAAGSPVRCFHFHLDSAARLGWPAYNAMAETWGAGEALFGALLDPSDMDRLTAFAERELRIRGFVDLADWARGDAVDQLHKLVDQWIDHSRALDADIIGGSVGAMQLCGTLYMMQRLEERGHRGVRVLGGSGLVGSVSEEVLKRASCVDYVVNGEGERAFSDLVETVRTTGKGWPIAGVCYRDSASGQVKSMGRAAPVGLAQVPSPDLAEFFETAARLKVPKTALTLSLEHSRGCEWEHRKPRELRGCTFCGLYRTSENFRRKSITQVTAEIRSSVARYRNLNLAFVDAYLPDLERDDLLDQINAIPEDITYFSELRCDLDAETVMRLARRARRVQLGVESFSTPLLRRIGKGVSAAQSAYCVRLCQEEGISTQYNLMLHIPGARKNEIDELRADLPTLFGLIPPEVTHFYLDRNSLIFREPARHGICAASLDAGPHEWLPACLGDSRVSQVVPFEPISGELGADWEEVAATVEEWRERWRAAQAAGLPSPLVWHYGSDWGAIVDMREPRAKVFDIDGLLFEVFLTCDQARSAKKIARLLPDRDVSEIRKALDELSALRLLFKDGPRYVRAAVRHSRGRR